MSKTIRCTCGREVHCSGFTTTCDCGRDYNLAPRSSWGEETGEHPTDVANLTGDEDWDD